MRRVRLGVALPHAAGRLAALTVLRLWFDQAYRGTYQQIGQLRAGAAADGLTLHVTGSHSVRSTPFLQACDAAFPTASQLSGEAYLEHALQVCADRGIEVFVPGRERVAVARAVGRFERLGVRVMVGPPEALRVLRDKALAHEVAQALGVPVPVTHVVTSAQGFRDAYEDLRARGLPVCLKPAVDHGARGFRVLDETVGTFDDLLEAPGPRVHPDDVERRLLAAGTVRPLLVSELLDGDELSVDTLSRDGELLCAVPRSKGGPQWTRLLVDDPAAVAIARTLVEGLGLRYLSNVQVRHGGGRVALLEVNARASSGLHHTAASGVNLPYAALRLLLDGEVRVGVPRTGATVLTYTEAREVVLPW